MAEKNIGRVVPNYKGDYDASVQYAKLDVVYHDDSKSSYVALADTRGENPYTTPSKWGVVARAKYQVGQQDLEAAVQAVINKNGVHIKGANAALGFSQDANAADTSTIKEVAPGTLSVSGNLNVLGNLNGNANSARALDHDIAINGQNIKTASGASNTLLADPQVTPINAGADLGVAATYPKVNARYSITGKYTNSPDDSVTWGHTLDVSSSLNGNLSLTLNGPGDRYVASIISGTFSGWTKVVSGAIGGRNLFLDSRVLSNGYNPNGTATVTVEPFDSTTNMWHLVAPQGRGDGVGIYLFNYGNGKIPDNSDWSYSADIKGTGKPSVFGIENGSTAPIKGIVGNDWSRISRTGHVNSPQYKTIVMYFNTTDSPLDVYIKLPKLEVGNVATDWMPAPEDINPNLAIGGRNLVLGTSEQVVQATDWNMKVADINYDKIIGRTLYASVLISNADHASDLHQGSSYIVLEAVDKIGNILKAVNGNSVLYNANGISQCSISMDDNTASVRVRIRTNNMSLNTYYSRLKVERGNIPTDWTPAPEDTVATANALTTKVATFKDFNDVAKNMNAYSGNWQVQGAMQIANSPYGIAPRSTYVSVQTAGWNDAGSITYYDFTTKDFFVGTVSSGNLTWTKMANDATVVHTTGNETIAGDKSLTGNTTMASVKTSSIKTGSVTANGLRIDFREFAAGVEVWFTGTFTGDASYSWHDLGQMPSNITKPFSFVTAVMGGRSGIGGVSTQTDLLLMVHINNTGKIQYQLRHGVENNTTDYKGIVLYVEGSTSYFK